MEGKRWYESRRPGTPVSPRYSLTVTRFPDGMLEILVRTSTKDPNTPVAERDWVGS